MKFSFWLNYHREDANPMFLDWLADNNAVWCGENCAFLKNITALDEKDLINGILELLKRTINDHTPIYLIMKTEDGSITGKFISGGRSVRETQWASYGHIETPADEIID